jgi:streptomycin 6-kinase
MAGVGKLTLPKGYRERLPRSWQPWLTRLPELVATYLERWELTVDGELPLSYSYVVPVTLADGRACVLKIQPTDNPDVEGAERELLGLRLGAPIAVGVVEEDAENGALLLERALPGTTLDEMAERNDDAATEAMAEVIRTYGRPVKDPGTLGLRSFEALAEVFERFDRGPHGAVARTKAATTPRTRLSVVLGLDEHGAKIPAVREARFTAERVLDELVSDYVEPYLLHGDLHHGNVLADEQRGLLVIDPWGLYGDRAVDVAPALENPLELVAQTADVARLVRRRLAIYGDVLGVDNEHMAAWCYVYVVIRALWSLQDGGEVSDQLRTIAALRHLI